MLSLRKKVLWWAVYSRGFVLTLQLLSNIFIADHASEDAFVWITAEPDSSSGKKDTVLDHLVSLCLDGFVRWDGHHFLHIANNGYVFEQSLAFFPIFPMLVSALSRLLYWVVSDNLSFISLLKLSAFVINSSAFLVAADVLYALSRRVLRDESLAYRAALLFCLNPSSVFFSAPYSEAVFAMCTFCGMLAFETSQSRDIGISSGFRLLCSGPLFAIAAATRSNGVLNAGFVVYGSMKSVATSTIILVRKMQKSLPAEQRTALALNAAKALLLYVMLPGVVSVMLCLGSFVAFQFYAYYAFCQWTADDMHLPSDILAAGRDSGYALAGFGNASWCRNDPPLAYLYVQKHYWNVGFLRYWEPKQLPQFALAAPAIGLTLWHTGCYLQQHWRYASRLGLVDNNQLGLRRAVGSRVGLQSLCRESFVYVVHATALALFGLTCMHVQVTTRLLMSSSPVLYWIGALLITNSESDLVPILEDDSKVKRVIWPKVERASNMESKHSTILLFEASKSSASSGWTKMYFFGYTLLGTVLFANNFPWT